MNVEYTGRQFEITPAIRKQVHTGLEKIQKILGSNFESHVILSVEKHRYARQSSTRPGGSAKSASPARSTSRSLVRKKSQSP